MSFNREDHNALNSHAPLMGATGPKERAYLRRLFQILNDPGRLRSTEAWIGQETKTFVRERGSDLRPDTRAALATLAKTISGVTIPLGLAWSLASGGTWWPTIFLVPLAGLALYGATSILHDTVHASFFPSKLANRVLGELLAPVFLLDFGSFRTSHMGHHRHSQSIEADPKYPKLPWPKLSSTATDAVGRPIADRPASLATLWVRSWLRVAARVMSWPRAVRHVFYVSTIVLFGGPLALVFGGDVSLMQRNWRRLGPWLALMRTVVFYGALFLVSPLLFVLGVGTLWFAMSCFFMLFLTHLSPYQLYMVSARPPAAKLFALNVSDIRLGFFSNILGNRFSEYHAAHHLFPFIPCYRLEQAGRWVDERFELLKAPVVQPLTVADSTFLGDGMIASVTRPPGMALPRWDTPVGSFIRRTAARTMPSLDKAAYVLPSEMETLRFDRVAA